MRLLHTKNSERDSTLLSSCKDPQTDKVVRQRDKEDLSSGFPSGKRTGQRSNLLQSRQTRDAERSEVLPVLLLGLTGELGVEEGNW